MTAYAFDEDRHALIALWDNRSSHVASTCAVLPRDIPAGAVQHLAQTLTWFSALA
ncbi:hypothetical protein [Actinomadura geliboluensis]|uniref:hypothetical protein n=1 Tax=Actinomadura geliboluensis TaxID=882440 RepID=UPI0037223403